MMKINWKLPTVSVAVGLLVSGALAASAVAQGVDPLDSNHNRNQDPFSNTDSNYEPFFDMMHRAQLGTIRSVSEYSKDQQENIGSQASDFRERQRQLIEQGQSPTGAPPASEPQPAPNTPVQPMGN